MESKIELCIRNFPGTFSESDIGEFLVHFGISGAKFLRRRNKISTIIAVSDESLAKCILARLHQLKIADKRLTVEYYNRQEVEIVDAQVEQHTRKQSAQKLSDFAKALNAVHPVDFTQPPPPYLKYRYPRPTREIIDSICVALESVPKFYTQVLHLMNRMNLPPPFNPRDLNRTAAPAGKKDAWQQTDAICIGQSLLAEGESELDSEEDVKQNVKATHKLGMNKLCKTRFKPYIVPQNVPASKNKLLPAELFEQPKIKTSSNIKIRIPEELKLVRSVPFPSHPEKRDKSPEPPLPENPSTITEQELLANRIPSDQLTELHVFKNYNPGTPSNKLYIKNLAKTVKEEDLQRIFYHFAFTSDPGREIDIKLMQSGRMKGQAFVTFSYIYEEDLERLPEKPVERALRFTNGFILKDKPMVVIYGKSTGKGAVEGKKA